MTVMRSDEGACRWSCAFLATKHLFLKQKGSDTSKTSSEARKAHAQTKKPAALGGLF